jgi:TldD protein
MNPTSTLPHPRHALRNPSADSLLSMPGLNPVSSPLELATDLLLTRNGLDESYLLRALAQARLSHGAYADLYFEHTHGESWSLAEGVISHASVATQQGLGVRVMAGERCALAHSHLISPEALARAALASRAIAEHGSGRDICVLDQAGPRPERASLYLADDPLVSIDEAAKFAILQQVDLLAYGADERVTRVAASLSAGWKVVLIVRGNGTLAADVRPMVNLNVTVTARSRERVESAQSSRSGRQDYSLFTLAVIEACVGEAVSAALLKLEAQAAPAGEMSVVLAAGTGGVLLHEAVGHGLEGDFNRKGQSLFAGRLGERVAARGVTLVDHGALPGLRGSLNVDDEGTSTRCTTLIEDGILKGYLHDRLTARMMGVPPTGNGRRESYAHMPIPRMTNTYMLGGTCDAQEMIASVKRGLFVAEVGGGQVDITNGNFVFTASVAYRIENGRLGAPVRGATLMGNGAQTMHQISMVGNDLAMDSGARNCSKAGQTIPVGVGQPTLRIDRMTVGGTADA